MKATVQRIAEAEIAVFSSPTFKAAYTGFLKAFLDQFSRGDGLRARRRSSRFALRLRPSFETKQVR